MVRKSEKLFNVILVIFVSIMAGFIGSNILKIDYFWGILIGLLFGLLIIKGWLQ
ncbi:MAG: hypothetical protein N3D75_04315 [Candidatus Aenigmarchaeota archaeon]|jgi:hypothetical protein|nr:hypothetical protein [Candidatus Aenigmarchaeota archaeon]